MAAAVSASRLGDDIGRLASFPTRNTCSDDRPGADAIGAAREWVRGQFLASGWPSVHEDVFTYRGCPGGQAVARANVVAVLPGARPDRVIVVGGHYDSRAYEVGDASNPAPGANDSGSQTALVLEAARVLAKERFEATLVLAAFAGEEQGLLGSARLAASSLGEYTGSATVEAMINCDIVGGDNTVNDSAALQQFRLFSPGTPREIRGVDGSRDDTSPSRGLMRYIGYWGQTYVPAMTMRPMLREDRPGRSSDHASFIDRGYPAVRFIESEESPNAGQAGSHQHSPDDLARYVTPSYTARIAQVVIAVTASLARAPRAPVLAAVTGTAAGPVSVRFTPPPGGPPVDHYVVAARSADENLYRQRLRVEGGREEATLTASELGLAGTGVFYVSVAAVDAAGHESLFAYPEYRCDARGCAVPLDALDITSRN